MATYDELMKQAEELKAQAAELKAMEKQEAITKVKALMHEHGIALSDLHNPKKAKKPAKYRDPSSGKTWTGRGRQPAWIKQHLESGKSLESMAAN